MNFQDLIAERLGGQQFGLSNKIYKFEKIKRAKEEAKRTHPDIPLIDMGVGEPDRPADKSLVDVLAAEAGKAENRWYADNGIPEFQQAAAEYLQRVFGLSDIDPRTQIVHGIGSKPILAMLPACFINPGDVTLMTVPGYPVLGTWTEYLGGEVYRLPLLAENQFFPDFSTIPADVLKRAKLLYLNYPNNPTGQVATRAFFEQAIAFARTNNIIVIHDAAYGGLVFDNEMPLSFLSVEGAMDVGMELFSLSKSYNMTGWRMAFAAGHPKLIQAYATVKDNTDSGQFRAIQKAAIQALKNDALMAANCTRYSRRFDALIGALNRVGFDARKPQATFYCYVKSPVGAAGGQVKFASAEDASEYLIKQAQISTVPWDDAGGYLRFSVTFSADTPEQEIEVINELERRLKALQLVF